MGPQTTKNLTPPPPPPLPGASAAAKLAATGRVLGVSGIAGGLAVDVAAARAPAPWRAASSAGLVVGGAVLAAAAPALFEALPPTYTLRRALLAGAAAGAGTALSNGCTSGHGVCGLARLSPRSAAATATFMVAGALTARFSGLLAALGVPASASGVAAAVAGDPAALALGGAALASLALLLALSAGTASGKGELLAEAGTSAAFAVGLGVSGMVRPSRVGLFFGPVASTASPWLWDPSLACVMGAALAIALPVTQWIKKHVRKALQGGVISLPASSTIDARLIGGAALFGVGWGAGGICPGPGIVAAAGVVGAAKAVYVAWVAAFAGGYAAAKKVAG